MNRVMLAPLVAGAARVLVTWTAPGFGFTLLVVGRGRSEGWMLHHCVMGPGGSHSTSK